MEISVKLDREACGKDSRLLDALEKGEQIVMSCQLWKFNAENKQQKRILLITTKNVYNITPQSGLTNIISKVVSNLRIKRKIPLSLIQGITVSRFGYEFVLHVPEQYDYRYSSLDFRDKILQILADTYLQINKRKLAFYIADDLNLQGYCTSKTDVKKGVKRIPKFQAIFLDGEEIKQHEIGKYVGQNSGKNKRIEECKIALDHFNILQVIGRGGLGQIYLAEFKEDKQLYVIKSLLKQEIITTDHLKHMKTERKLMQDFQFPFILYLQYAFQTQERIFYVLPFIQGGDLFFHLKREKRLKEERVKFYAAQITLALGYIHDKDYVYRDLKPENILIDEQGYLVLTDFGLSKSLLNNSLTNSFVGTTDYLAPEIISAQGHGKMVDWWALGILVYEMLVGITPFYSENQSQMFENILEGQPKYPQTLNISNEAKDIIQQLLKKDPKERLGHKKGVEDVKAHSWFQTINFNQLLQRDIVPSFKPKISGPTDLSNFDPEFTQEVVMLDNNYVSDMQLLQKFQDEFYSINYDPRPLKQNTKL